MVRSYSKVFMKIYIFINTLDAEAYCACKIPTSIVIS